MADSEQKMISIRSATLADRRAVWDWIARSDLTASMMGPPNFAENPVPTWEQHCADYLPYFFDGSRPGVGRSLIIEFEGRAVGHVSYSRGDELSGAEPGTLPGAELDIWMRDSSCCGHGWGSAALRMLCEHLHDTLGMREFIMRPSARNVRAIRSYEKAGFERLALTDAQQTAMYGPGEYQDTVTMRRVIE